MKQTNEKNNQKQIRKARGRSEVAERHAQNLSLGAHQSLLKIADRNQHQKEKYNSLRFSQKQLKPEQRIKRIPQLASVAPLKEHISLT